MHKKELQLCVISKSVKADKNPTIAITMKITLDQDVNLVKLLRERKI